MPTKEEARLELARRELERRKGQRDSTRGFMDIARSITPMGMDIARSITPMGMAEQAVDAFRDPTAAFQRTDDFMRGAAGGLTFGFADKIAGYLGGEGTEAERAKTEQARRRSPVETGVAEMGGTLLGAGKLMGAGVTSSRLVPQGATGVKGLLARSGASAADALVFNELLNLGNDRDFGENAGTTAVVGGAAYPLVSGASKTADIIKGMLGFGNKPRAQKAITEALARSGKTADDIVDDIVQAQADGQGVYTVADSLGDSGQRMLAGVARTPGDMRSVIRETLDARQAGQGRRVANALSEGFDATDTAAQRHATLKQARATAGQVNYRAAREAAIPVDVTGAIAAIDDVVASGANRVVSQGSNIADDTIEGALNRVRRMLSDGKSNLSDFSSVLRVKQDIDDIIGKATRAGSDNKARLLIGVRNQLDDALANASPPYAAARDAYREGSKAIDAIGTGTTAAKRGRVEDTIPAFQKMSPQEQSAFRAGYADPLIEKAQNSATGVNKARPLINDATQAEFPAFAAPSKADQLGRRIARENTMFETRNAALGGSKTADNLADIADVSTFDPGLLANLFMGNFKTAATQGLTRGAQALQGRNQATRDMIAKMLLQGAPTKAKADVASAISSGKKLTEKQLMIARMLMAGGVVALPES